MRRPLTVAGGSCLALSVALLGALVPFYISIARHTAAAPSAGLSSSYHRPPLDHAANVFVWLALLTFACLGALIVARRPGNRVGWLFCAIGVTFSIEWFTAVYAVDSLLVRSEPWPGHLTAAWVNGWIWAPAFALMIVALPLLYPDGRTAGRWGRAVGWTALFAALVSTSSMALHDGELAGYVAPLGIDNPLAVSAIPADGPLTHGSFLLLVATMLGAVWSMVARLRAARGRERDQLRWFAFSGSILVLLFVAQFVVRYVLGIASPAFEVPLTVLWGVAFLALPAATGLAVLRHRLYDIDRLINRTLVYGVVTVLLVAVYAVGVLATSGLLTVLGVGGGNDVGVAAATLAVAAAFGPLRRRVQRLVDRRFYRARYDAGRAVERLAGRLRSEVDPDAVGTEIVHAARTALQPSTAGLWLRSP